MVYGIKLWLFKATSNESIYITHRREEITSPWSIPILALYGSDRPLAVITLLDLLLKRLSEFYESLRNSKALHS